MFTQWCLHAHLGALDVEICWLPWPFHGIGCKAWKQWGLGGSHAKKEETSLIVRAVVRAPSGGSLFAEYLIAGLQNCSRWTWDQGRLDWRHDRHWHWRHSSGPGVLRDTGSCWEAHSTQTCVYHIGQSASELCVSNRSHRLSWCCMPCEVGHTLGAVHTRSTAVHAGLRSDFRIRLHLLKVVRGLQWKNLGVDQLGLAALEGLHGVNFGGAPRCWRWTVLDLVDSPFRVWLHPASTSCSQPQWGPP